MKLGGCGTRIAAVSWVFGKHVWELLPPLMLLHAKVFGKEFIKAG